MKKNIPLILWGLLFSINASAIEPIFEEHAIMPQADTVEGRAALRAADQAMDAAKRADITPDGRYRNDVGRVMNQNKGALLAVYKAGLALHPDSHGSYVVHIKIAPDGRMISTQLVSSELNDDKTEAKLLTLIQGFKFSSGAVEVWEGNYKYNFVAQP